MRKIDVSTKQYQALKVGQSGKFAQLFAQS